ncbi:MAG TPA: hypothetical protein GX513_12915 [Firmicutes bacterium]|nr:hypothetical protein [Bacillota bacterium]
MKRAETVQLLAFITAFYPDWKLTEATIEAWHEMLHDLEFDVVKTAIKRVISRKRFLPTVAEIREETANLLQPEIMSGEEAWAIVANAVREYGYYREMDAREQMPALVEKAVKAIGWDEICLSEEPGVVRAHFMRLYEAMARREREEITLPADTKALPGVREPRALPRGKRDTEPGLESLGSIAERLLYHVPKGGD